MRAIVLFASLVLVGCASSADSSDSNSQEQAYRRRKDAGASHVEAGGADAGSSGSTGNVGNTSGPQTCRNGRAPHEEASDPLDEIVLTGTGTTRAGRTGPVTLTIRGKSLHECMRYENCVRAIEGVLEYPDGVAGSFQRDSYSGAGYVSDADGAYFFRQNRVPHQPSETLIYDTGQYTSYGHWSWDALLGADGVHFEGDTNDGMHFRVSAAEALCVPPAP